MNAQTRYEFLLVCRACGTEAKKVLTQFDELPNCKNCGSEMLVENVIKETD